ncbi:MAG: tRNA lysidine(34) synthetase TilS [Verrucomicrobia bacterium]|nr:tRNA lysidine(34) synthetase TilS [Verrucomicrobiota bacterium]
MKPSPRSKALQTKATRLAELLPRTRLHPAVLAYAEASPAKEPWAVALSGGADSLALLLLLWAYWPERRARLHALHFDHRLRGRSSTADAKFCRDVCAKLGVKFHHDEWRVAGRAQLGEAGARAARQAFFELELKRFRGRLLWLGHQQDDVAETMFMRLARGSGTAGLAAPRPVQVIASARRRVHLRPLLNLKKAELAAALREAGIIWREDASNAGGAFLRNRMRQEVLPVWVAASGRDSLAGAALSRELLEEDDAALEAWLQELAPLGADGALHLRKLGGKPRAVWRRALHRWLLQQPQGGRNLSRQAFEALLRDVMALKRTRHSLDARSFAVIARDRLTRVETPRKKSR